MAETPAPTAPQMDTSSGQAIATAMSTIAAAISGIVGTVSAVELERMENPCIRLADLENRLVQAQAGVDRMIAGANFFAAASQAAVVDSIENWGAAHGGISRTGGKPFAAWIFEAGVIQHAPEALLCYPFPPVCLLAIEAGLPPDGSEQPSSSNNGYRVGPGLYRHPGATGTWRGTTFVAEWEAWKTYQENNVWSPAAGRPNWKARLVSWCGRNHSGWQTWIPGSSFAKSSLIGMKIQEVAAFEALVVEARVRCAELEEVTYELAQDESSRLDEMVKQAGESSAAQLELAAATLESEERQITTIAIVGLLGLALVTLWDKK